MIDRKMHKRLYRLFSNPKKLALLNGLLIAVLIACNVYFQAFCIPTRWALLVLAICFANTILFPLWKRTTFAPFSSFISGISFCVFAYCIVFMEAWNLFGWLALIIGLGFVLIIPQFFLVQLIWHHLIRPVSASARYWFLSALLLCLVTALYIRYDYQRALIAIEKLEKSNYTVLEKNYMTEKILGMHFRYHTRILLLIDGWRPPIHDPILVMGMWLNDRNDPLDVSLATRLELYKRFFPDKAYKLDCSCGIQYSVDYHQAALWVN